jgi:hypothetical protein
MKDRVKKVAVQVMIVMNIVLVGATIGAYLMHSYDTKNAQAVQAQAKNLAQALK